MIYLKSAPPELVRLHRESVATTEEAAARIVREGITRIRATLETGPADAIPPPISIPSILPNGSRELLGRLLSEAKMNHVWREFARRIACQRRNKTWSVENHGRTLHAFHLWGEIEEARQGPNQFEAMTESQRREIYSKAANESRALAETLRELEINPPVGILMPGHGILEKETKSFSVSGKPITCVSELLEEVATLAAHKGNIKGLLPRPSCDSAAVLFFIRKLKDYLDFWLSGFTMQSLCILAWVCLDLSVEPDTENMRKRLQGQRKE